MPQAKEKLDWRCHGVSELATDTNLWGKNLPQGIQVSKQTAVNNQNLGLFFCDPCASALYLNQSFSFLKRSREKFPLLTLNFSTSHNQKDTQLFDYFEHVMGSIVFAFMAIESFANDEIPDDYQYLRISSKDGKSEKLGKDGMERIIPLDEKLDLILPEILQKGSPKGTKNWEDYIGLKRLRHDIVHLKSLDRISSNPKEMYPDSIWAKLLSPTPLDYGLVAKNMILHFAHDKGYYW